MTRLCLIRHGQTDWNLEGRYHGQIDVPLNQSGRIQASELARKLQNQIFAAIYTSDLQRAKETATIIAAAMHLPVMQDSRLREINQGEWEGQLVDVIKARYATLWQQRTSDPLIARPPGGETVVEVAERVYSALNDIVLHYPAVPVLVVSHGLALATAICKVRDISIEMAYTMIPENAEPVWIIWPD